MPDIGEIFECQQERGNSEDLYSVSKIKDDVRTLLIPSQHIQLLHPGIVVFDF